MSAQRRARARPYSRLLPLRQKTQYANVPDTGHFNSRRRKMEDPEWGTTHPRTRDEANMRREWASQGSLPVQQRKQQDQIILQWQQLHSVVCTCKAERSALCSRLPFGSAIRMVEEKRTQRRALLHPRISNAHHAGSTERSRLFFALFARSWLKNWFAFCSLCCWAPCFGCVLGAQMCNL